LGHKEFLLGVKKGGTLTPPEEEVLDLKISDYLIDFKASIDMDYQDALLVAMHREKTAFKLYTGMAEMTDDKEMKWTFKMLAQQEAKHKLRLELIYDEEVLAEN
jgi:rubrerythrin